MNTITWNQSIRQFLEQAASSSPTPGGGSVAAFVAALGSSMTSMVGNLTTGEKYTHIQPQIAAVIEKMNSLIFECEALLQADIASFNKYMGAFKLPKNTAEEKAERSAAILEAAIEATEVPIALIELCKIGIDYTYSIAETANMNVISDLGIGAILFEASAQASLLTVEINLASLQDEMLKKQYENKVNLLMAEIVQLKMKVLQTVRERINQ